MANRDPLSTVGLRQKVTTSELIGLTGKTSSEGRGIGRRERGVWLIVAVCCGCLIFVIRIARVVVDAFRLALARDRLGAPPPLPTTPPRKRRGVLHVLFVSREPLGVDPEPPHPPRSLLRILFAPERLPLDPEPPAGPRRRGWLAALLAPEKLDDAP